MTHPLLSKLSLYNYVSYVTQCNHPTLYTGDIFVSADIDTAPCNSCYPQPVINQQLVDLISLAKRRSQMLWICAESLFDYLRITSYSHMLGLQGQMLCLFSYMQLFYRFRYDWLVIVYVHYYHIWHAWVLSHALRRCFL